MWLQARCELFFEIENPTPFLFMLRPRSGDQQWIAQERYDISPSTNVREFADKNGNLCQRLVALPGDFKIRTSSTVRTADASDEDLTAAFISIEDLPNNTLEYLLPSRYCESDVMQGRVNDIVRGKPLGYQQVKAISEWIASNIEYLPGSSNFPIGSVDILQKQRGVCRDLAHVGISLCRSLSIPARFVVGYLNNLEPMDIHAWFEAYVGGRWFTFDATQDSLAGGRIAIAYGRDAADVAIANQFGPAVFPYHMMVNIKQLVDFKPMF